MFRRSDKKRNSKSRPVINNGPDSHRWETKMEIIRLISGKQDLEIKAFSGPVSYPAQTK